MTSKIVEATEVQFEEVPVAEETMPISTMSKPSLPNSGPILIPPVQNQPQHPLAGIAGVVHSLAAAAIPTKVYDYDNKYFLLENVHCFDSHGHLFEDYPALYVRKDVERGADFKEKLDCQLSWIENLTKEGLFLPSMALSCSILAALYQHRNYPSIEKVLQQYKKTGYYDIGSHAQNTLIDWNTFQITHYPENDDFPKPIRINNHGQSRKSFSFGYSGMNLVTEPLAEAIKKPAVKAFVRNLTGLADPSILAELGEYICPPGSPDKKSVLLVVPQNNKTRPVWLGKGANYFNIFTGSDFYYQIAARGVRVKP